MKTYLFIFSILIALNLEAQRVYVAYEHMNFNIEDAEYLDSNDGAIKPNITMGFRPFSYAWYGPDNFVSTDSVLENVRPGKYFVKMEDALCGKFSDTIEIRAIHKEYETPNDIFVKKISPNPFVDHIKIQIESEAEQTVNIRVFHNSGRLFYEDLYNLELGVQEFELNNIAWINGIYVIQICNNDKCQITKKIIRIE